MSAESKRVEGLNDGIRAWHHAHGRQRPTKKWVVKTTLAKALRTADYFRDDLELDAVTIRPTRDYIAWKITGWKLPGKVYPRDPFNG